MSQNPLVSCLCVTRNRVPLLRRAISCFLSQTYQPRELVIVSEADDLATRAYLDTIRDPSILAVELRSSSKLPLGCLRNVAIQCSRGTHIAQWDDDDWYAPDRLAEQIKALQETGAAACVLMRWLMYDAETGRAYLSSKRTWEGSLVADKNVVPSYPALKQGEDTQVIKQLGDNGKLILLDKPTLYVYVFHGGNTWQRQHWQGLLERGAQLLPVDDTRWVQSRMAFLIE